MDESSSVSLYYLTDSLESTRRDTLHPRRQFSLSKQESWIFVSHLASVLFSRMTHNNTQSDGEASSNVAKLSHCGMPRVLRHHTYTLANPICTWAAVHCTECRVFSFDHFRCTVIAATFKIRFSRLTAYTSVTNNVLMKTLCRCFYSSVIWLMLVLRRIAWMSGALIRPERKDWFSKHSNQLKRARHRYICGNFRSRNMIMFSGHLFASETDLCAIQWNRQTITDNLA